EEGAVEGRAGGAFPTELRSCRSPATTPAPQPVISPPQRCPRGERKLKNVHLSSHPHDGTAGFVNSPPFNPLKDRTSRPGLGGGLKNDTTKRHAAAGSDACRWCSGDGERPATATWWWRKACGGTAFRTGAAHGSATDAGAADAGTAHVVTTHVRAANRATHGTATYADAYGYT